MATTTERSALTAETLSSIHISRKTDPDPDAGLIIFPIVHTSEDDRLPPLAFHTVRLHYGTPPVLGRRLTPRSMAMLGVYPKPSAVGAFYCRNKDEYSYDRDVSERSLRRYGMTFVFVKHPGDDEEGRGGRGLSILARKCPSGELFFISDFSITQDEQGRYVFRDSKARRATRGSDPKTLPPYPIVIEHDPTSGGGGGDWTTTTTLSATTAAALCARTEMDDDDGGDDDDKGAIFRDLNAVDHQPRRDMFHTYGFSYNSEGRLHSVEKPLSYLAFERGAGGRGGDHRGGRDRDTSLPPFLALAFETNERGACAYSPAAQQVLGIQSRGGFWVKKEEGDVQRKSAREVLQEGSTDFWAEREGNTHAMREEDLEYFGVRFDQRDGRLLFAKPFTEVRVYWPLGEWQ